MSKLLIVVILAVFLVVGVSHSGEINEISPKRAQFIVLINENIKLKRSDGEDFVAKNVLIKDLDEEKTVGYYYVDSQINFSALESIEIVVNDGQFGTKIKWPYVELGNLVEYFSRNMSTDCTGFASFIKGKSVARWSGQSDLLFMVPGDAVRLSEDKGCYKYIHHAVYLGEDLYISDYGPRNDVIISTLSQMREVYPSKFVCLLNP